jgi:hypothetical protein
MHATPFRDEIDLPLDGHVSAYMIQMISNVTDF